VSGIGKLNEVALNSSDHSDLVAIAHPEDSAKPDSGNPDRDSGKSRD
jgi:hypothetical protein